MSPGLAEGGSCSGLSAASPEPRGPLQEGFPTETGSPGTQPGPWGPGADSSRSLEAARAPCFPWAPAPS